MFSINDMLNGHTHDLYEYFGVHKLDDKYVFRLYAPNAKEVYIYGEFNNWNKKNSKLQQIENGIWEIELAINETDRYKYIIRTRDDRF